MFNNDSAYADYVSLLEKRRFFLRFPTQCPNLFARHMAKGLEKYRGRSLRFANFTQRQLSMRAIDEARVRPISSTAFLFAFRVTSETLPPARAYSDDSLRTFHPAVERR